MIRFSTNRDEVVADRTSSVSWSEDNGLTWSTPNSIDPKGDLYAETMLRRKDGDALLLPLPRHDVSFVLRPTSDTARC